LEVDRTIHKIKSIKCIRILNSHLGFTNEFVIELENGNIGTGASPQGETIGIYEDRMTRSDTQKIIEEIQQYRLLVNALTQSDFDDFLRLKTKQFGRNNCWALSLAFFNAVHFPLHKFWAERGVKAGAKFPRLCLNILNGGQHAYTNPVLSDFSEYLLVPKHDTVHKVIRDHAEIQREVKDGLARCERIVVNQNPVHRFKTTNNAECIGFLQEILERLGLIEEYNIMIDASAGDLWTGDGYKFSVTDGSFRSTPELEKYWVDLINEYGIGLLEDPFQEHDYNGWKVLVDSQSICKIIGDNLYSSDADRIEQGSRNGYTHGTIIKPNQAGTVSAVQRAVDMAQSLGQLVITSHRSISTESVFLSHLSVFGGVGYMKIGPLYTDYSSIIRLNELIRLTGVNLD
jgi:enolase 1/2/3